MSDRDPSQPLPGPVHDAVPWRPAMGRARKPTRLTGQRAGPADPDPSLFGARSAEKRCPLHPNGKWRERQEAAEEPSPPEHNPGSSGMVPSLRERNESGDASEPETSTSIGSRDQQTGGDQGREGGDRIAAQRRRRTDRVAKYSSSISRPLGGRKALRLHEERHCVNRRSSDSP